MLLRIFFLTLFLVLQAPLAHADAQLCLDLFKLNSRRRVAQKVNKVFTTQSAIGRFYAEVKLLKNSGLGNYKSVSDVRGKDLKQLKGFVAEVLKDPLPAVLSPSGEIFIIDGHHDLYDVVLLSYKLDRTDVAIEIVRDYRSAGFTTLEFQQDLVAREWADIDSVQKPPKLISELENSPERSLAGLSFLYIRDSGVSLVGKYFVPRVQFKLIDLVKEENLFDFDQSLDAAHIQSFADLIVTNAHILDFLIRSLLPTAPKGLRKFLHENLQKAKPDFAHETLQN